MTNRSMLLELERLLQESQVRWSGPVHFCHFEDKIQCLPASHTNQKHTVFRHLSHWHQVNGLKANEWLNLAYDVFTFMKELNKCHEQ